MEYTDEIFITGRDKYYYTLRHEDTDKRYIHESKVPVSCGGTMEDKAIDWAKIAGQNQHQIEVLADRIETLEKDNKLLREALQIYIDKDPFTKVHVGA